MQTVLLNHRPTTQLGFGGSLLGSTSPQMARRLLSEAFDCGIRHFDVAPMYGFGQAECLLREALGSRLQQVTITTKYGLTAPIDSPWRRTARRLLTPFPGLHRRLRRNAVLPTDSEPLEDPQAFPLTAAGAQASIDRSLRHLGVETLDLFLLHEATPGRLHDSALFDLLEQNRTAGKLREFGIGSRRSRVTACLEQCPAYCRFVQYEWSAFATPSRLLKAHPRSVHGSLGSAQPAWMRDPALLDCWSDTVRLDLHRPGTVPALLLKASLLANAGHIVLFSTRTPERIRANIATAEDGSLEEPARAFLRLVQREQNVAL